MDALCFDSEDHLLSCDYMSVTFIVFLFYLNSGLKSIKQADTEPQTSVLVPLVRSLTVNPLGMQKEFTEYKTNLLDCMNHAHCQRT